MMLDYLVDENGIDIENDDVNFIKALIQGNVTKSFHFFIKIFFIFLLFFL